MTPREVKEYLSQVRDINRIIDNKIDELEKLEYLSVRITSVMKEDRVQESNGSRSRLEDCVSKIVDLKNEILDSVDELLIIKKEVMETIDKIGINFSDVLYKRYFQFLTWDEIAAETGNTRQWVAKLHGEALQRLCNLKK